MNRRGLLLVAAVAAAACGKSTEKPGARLSEPTAAAVFRGYTGKVPGVAHPYVAVVNLDGDELRLIDAVDDQVVEAPIIFYPLSVPTGSRPSAVVASTFDFNIMPVSDTTATPDLLAVVPGGTAELQIVSSWSAAPTVDPSPSRTLDLRSVPNGAGADAEILAVIAVPVPDASMTRGVADKRVRIVAALSGARLAMVDVVRKDGLSLEFDLATVTVQPAGFQATSLAAFPATDTGTWPDLSHVYASTLDELPQAPTLPAAGGGFPAGTVLGIHGVAELDLSSGPPGPWAVRGLSALAPTRVAAAFATTEWFIDPAAGHPDLNPQTYDLGGPHRRIYASLDPSGCGVDQPINCGIAVLDPAAPLDPVRGHLLPDPAGELPYLAPLPLGNPMISAGLPVAFAPSGLPATGPLRIGPITSTDPLQSSNTDTMVTAPATGQFNTTAVAAVPSTDGTDHWFDLAHWSIPSDTSILRTGTRAQVPSGTIFPLPGVVNDPPLVEPPPSDTTSPSQESALLGLWTKDALGNDVVTVSPLLMSLVFQVTPGYTPNDSWAVVWQGSLPGLARRRAVIANGTPLTLALQEQSGTPPTFDSVVRLYDPSLGVQPGDIVEVWLDDPSVCTGTTIHDPTVSPDDRRPTFETTVVDLLPPDKDRWPGGAVTLASPLLGRWDASGSTHLDPGCTFNAPVTAFVTIRASGLVVTGAKTLYAGRPTGALPPQLDATYALRWQPEAPLQAACTLLPWNPAWETGAATPPACDAACRGSCEQLVLARKARRLFYLTDRCPSPGIGPTDECLNNYPQFRVPPTTGIWNTPEPIGPVLSFRVGQEINLEPSAAHPRGVTFIVQRGAQISFSTQAGLSPAVRRPIGSAGTAGAVLPLGAVPFDRTRFLGHEAEGVRFFSVYPDNLVLDWSVSTSQADARILR